MIPKSLSATSMNVAQLCMARWKAEMFEKAGGPANTAASLGTSVHGALELYVTKCILAGEFPATIATLLLFFKMTYTSTFGSSDVETEEYKDGVDMLQRWHARTDFTTFEVLTCEVKTSFDITTSAGPIPFNYIWDRFDRIDADTIRVVDYKSNRWDINPLDLKKKIQARAYGVAAQIQYPEAKKIWVEFDMLRHDGPKGIVFSREENIGMWRFMQETAERIIGTSEEDTPETLNAECRFCIRKFNCTALQKNIAVGGLMAFASPQDAIDLRAALEWQLAGINSTMKDLDAMILAQAKAEDAFEYESTMNRMSITVSGRRNVDAERVEQVIGPQLFEKYGGKSFTVGNVDKLIKGTELTDQQKVQLKGLVWIRKGEPSVKVESKNPIDDGN